MIYITLDTCLWLELIKINLGNENNEFEEICFWIENKHITHITPRNIIREWERNKVSKLLQAINDTKSLQRNIIKRFPKENELYSFYEPEVVERAVSKRMERVDAILKIHSEIAEENQQVYKEAIDRNLNCLAPNHDQDSFRDTINILTLIHHLKKNGYSNCIFSTKNFKDFSEGKDKKNELHPDLSDDFKDSNLKYIYSDEKSFGGKVLHQELRPILPSFIEHLKKKKQKEEEEALKEKKSVVSLQVDNPDKDYLDNIRYIDIIFAKKEPTPFDLDIIKSLIKRHTSYRQYFFNNIGNNGLV